VVLIFVLGLGMLVVPSLTATSINGDREHGVLPTMQTTLLTSADIVVGKLVAAWALSIAFLLAASPFLVWAWIAGGIEIGRVLLAVAVLAFVLAVICAVGLMFSTLTARTLSSAVLTYLTVAALTCGTVIAFLISMPILATQQTVRVKVVPDSWFQQNEPADPESKGTTAPTAADCVYVNGKQSFLGVLGAASTWVAVRRLHTPIRKLPRGTRIA
jgi:ABC-type transport system involved in multi-copper enzyme maturation permease subunit